MILDDLAHLPKYSRVKFKIEVPDQAAMVTDRVLLQSVFKNLIHNAINYSSRLDPKVEILIREKEKTIELAVMDNGEGIPEAIQPKIFDMFYRGHLESEGSGLGLFVVKNALEKMKGNIRFQTATGKGTVFYVTFPKNLLD